MLKTIEDVARELATDMCKLEIVDYGTKIRWKDTREIVAFRHMLTPAGQLIGWDMIREECAQPK